jgi:uncharacterized protein YuzE
MLMSKVTIDSEYQLAYITLGLGDFAKTICVSNSCNVDIDQNGDVIGVEFLTLQPLDLSVDELAQVTQTPEKVHSAIRTAGQLMDIWKLRTYR